MSAPEPSGSPKGDHMREVLGGTAFAGRFEQVLDAVEQAAAEILEEAELEAQRRIQAAEARAERLARERAADVSRQSDVLIERAGSVRERADALLEALESAIADLGHDTGSSPPSESAPVIEPPPAAKKPPKPAKYPKPATPGPPVPADPEPEPDSNEGGADPIRSLREKLSSIGRPPRQVPLGTPAASPRPAAPKRDTTPGPLARPSGPTPGPRGGPGASEGAILLATQMAVAGASRDQIEQRLRNDFGIDDPTPILERIGS